MQTSHVEIVQADLGTAEHQQAYCALLNHYASDPAGGGHVLDESALMRSLAGMAERSYAHCFLAKTGDRFVGLSNCLEGFSTFAGKPLLNIHDIVVHQDYRGQGVATQMLAFIEQFAGARGWCKLTLEVLEGNRPARLAYEKFGFAGYELDQTYGQAQFMHKQL